LLIAACAFVTMAAAGLVATPSQPNAQGSCRAICWEGYGACYKATNSRQRCQAQLQRCLSGCIRKKH
jgi:hypothetical protein